MWCHSFPLSEPFALAISFFGLHSGSLLGPGVILTMREFASRARKSRMLSMRIDTQFVALVSHVCAATKKGYSRLEEMSI